jgi:hypothetical protein
MFLVLQRVAHQANAHLPAGERMKVSPHVLRHTFLRKLAEEKGVQYAKEASGHKSDRYIWRYEAKPVEFGRSDRRAGGVGRLKTYTPLPLSNTMETGKTGGGPGDCRKITAQNAFDLPLPGESQLPHFF